MSVSTAYPTLNLPCLATLGEIILRLFLPILVIYLLPTEETFFQNLFQGEGFCRILGCAWSFRSSLLLSVKKTGLCSIAFLAEEVLQETFLYFLI